MESRVLHSTSLLFILIGIIGGLLLWVLSFGLSNLALFFMLSAVPFAVFFVLLYGGKHGKLFWTIESGLLTLGIVGLVLGFLSSGKASTEPANDIGLLIIGSYFAFLLLNVIILTLFSGLIRAQLVLHNLDRLAVAAATGWISDTSSVSRRFEKIMEPIWRAEQTHVTRSGWLLGFRMRKEFGDYRDDVIYQWVIETYGSVPFKAWITENEARLKVLLGMHLKWTESCQSQAVDRPQDGGRS